MKQKRDAMDAAGLRHQEPQPVQERAPHRWPKGAPMPQAYVRPMYFPCPSCSSVLTNEGGRAVALRALSKGLAYLRCKVCGHLWKLPVKDAESGAVLDPKPEN